MIEPSSDRTLRDKVQGIGSRSSAGAFDAQHGMRYAHVGDFHLASIEIETRDFASMGIDDHPRALEAHISVDAGDRRPTLQIVECHPLRLD